ncbi:organic cation transporter protein isoform X2 [Procambarus clarkii]|uniref:organic cation transporter protein isoform X2 n=1 Tax=Procambarus clarkii TaxID=6728 RepID=UPI001E670E39|nr:organic cation transporter protein-like isoform X2 [Procambarus clarkii]
MEPEPLRLRPQSVVHSASKPRRDSCSYTVNRSSSGALEEEPCTEWDFDTSVFSNTLTSEFSLVCSREHLRATYQGVYMLGTFLSPLLGGYLADRYGRRVVVVTTQAVTVATSVGLCFLSNLTAILVVRFFMGSVNLLTLFIYAMEVCEPKHRGTVGILTGLPWALGTMAWGGVAYFIRDWRYLQAAVSLPTLLIFIPLYFMDESPRWLIVNGHHERALAILQKAARWNNATLPPEEDLRALMKIIQEESSTPIKAAEPSKEAMEESRKRCSCSPSLPSLISTRAVTLVTVVVCLDFFAVSLVFDGLNLSGDNYSADPFLYIILGGLMEVPGYSLTAPIIDRWGRKIPTAVSYILCGLLLLLLAFIPSGSGSWVVVSLAMGGKVCISGAYQIIYVYASELFPTEVRLQGIGAASEFAQLASTILPYITTYLGPLVPWVPSAIFAAVAFIAGFLTLALRETAGRPLPDTITDLAHISSSRTREKSSEVSEMEKMNIEVSETEKTSSTVLETENKV